MNCVGWILFVFLLVIAVTYAVAYFRAKVSTDEAWERVLNLQTEAWSWEMKARHLRRVTDIRRLIQHDDAVLIQYFLKRSKFKPYQGQTGSIKRG